MKCVMIISRFSRMLWISISDSMAMDSDGNLMMRMGDHMAMDMDTGDIHMISSWSDDDGE